MAGGEAIVTAPMFSRLFLSSQPASSMYTVFVFGSPCVQEALAQSSGCGGGVGDGGGDGVGLGVGDGGGDGPGDGPGDGAGFGVLHLCCWLS